MRAAAVIEKDLRSELRTRYGLTALALFVVTAVSLVVFSVGEEPLPKPLMVAITWIVMLFTSMTGLGRAFVSEEERGTSLFLRLTTTPQAVFLGKLVVNIVWSVTTNALALLLLSVMVPAMSAGRVDVLAIVVLAGSIGMAAVMTIVSAIVAKAGARNAVLPVLSFPLLLPVLIPGSDATLLAMAGFGFGDVLSSLGIMFAYTGLVIIVSWLVFEVIWCD
jgi:heme exporter protein B